MITSSRDAETDTTVVTVVGSATAEEVRDQAINFLQGEPTQLVLWDLRQGTIADVSPAALRMLVDAGKPYAHRRRGGKTAIVCVNDVDFGLSRMFQIIAELQHLPFQINVFRDMNDAISWLVQTD